MYFKYNPPNGLHGIRNYVQSGVDHLETIAKTD